MTQIPSNGGALGHMDEQVSDTAAALAGLAGPAGEAAQAIDQAFAKAGESLARSLARAASDGKISLQELASAIIGAVDSAAGTAPVSGGLGGVLGEIFKTAGVFGGARADGGPVTGGGAYLVGERGPEIFRPGVSGMVEAATAAPGVQVTVVVPGGAQALVRSEAQVAAALQRAARMGMR